MSNNEKIKNLAAIIQSVTLTLAVIVGGSWTLYTFRTLGQQQKAKYDLIGKPSLNIEIETITTHPMDTNAYSGLIINVNIENKGTRYITLQTLDSVLCVTEVGYANSETMGSLKNLYLEPVLRYEGGDTLNLLNSISIQPNSKKTVAYYCELKYSGVYFISFLSQNSMQMERELSELNGSIDSTKIKKSLEELGVSYEARPGFWFAGKYIEIK